jgi:FKBP-type peptidyl-prolyl cis-trans isomerase FkpA
VTRFALLLLLLLLSPPLLSRAEGTDDAATTEAGGTAPAVAELQADAVPPVSTAIAGPQLLVEDLRTGPGQEAISGTAVAVHYTGWLQDKQAPGHKGRQFDSSHGRNAFVFPLGGGRVIKGWDLGIIGMKVGGLRRLTIPPELGYGSRAVGGGLIPANSTLIFEVELLAVESVRDMRGDR